MDFNTQRAIAEREATATTQLRCSLVESERKEVLSAVVVSHIVGDDVSSLMGDIRLKISSIRIP